MYVCMYVCMYVTAFLHKTISEDLGTSKAENIPQTHFSCSLLRWNFDGNILKRKDEVKEVELICAVNWKLMISFPLRADPGIMNLVRTLESMQSVNENQVKTTAYYICQSVRVVWLVNFAGRISLYGPLHLKVVPFPRGRSTSEI